MWCEPGKWTCPEPSCHRTVVIDGSPEDTAAAIEAVQRRHGKAHREALQEQRVQRWMEKMRRDMGLAG